MRNGAYSTDSSRVACQPQAIFQPEKINQAPECFRVYMTSRRILSEKASESLASSLQMACMLCLPQLGMVVQQSAATHGSDRHCLPAVVPLSAPVQSYAITGLPGPGSMLEHVCGGARVQHWSDVHSGSPFVFVMLHL